MKNTLKPFAVMALFLSLVVIPLNAHAITVDNTINYTGIFGLINPCNGELASGPIDINIVVTTAVTGNGEVKVNVHHSSHAAFMGNQGNEYQASRRAKGQFSAITNHYTIPWVGEFIGKGTAPNFNASGTLTVHTNAENEPIGSNLTSMTTSCQ